MYNAKPSPPGRETITIEDRRRIKIEYVRNMGAFFHGKSDQRITLVDAAYVSDLGFNLYSLHAVQRTHLIVSDASGTHIIGANLTFPRGSYLRATRLSAGTVGARRRQGDMRATNLLRQLCHHIPPPSQNPPPPPPQEHVRDWFKFKCSWSCSSTGTDSLSPSQFSVGGSSVRRENPQARV